MPEEQVAASEQTQQLIAAAKAARDKQEQVIPIWGTEVRIAPAPAPEFYKLRRQAENFQKAGLEASEQQTLEVAWVAACVVEPKLDIHAAGTLRDANPGDFSQLSRVCQFISEGSRPISLLMLGAWAEQAERMTVAEGNGDVAPGLAKFWRAVIVLFAAHCESGTNGQLDTKALGEALIAVEDDPTHEAALQAVETWEKQQGVEEKNVSEEETGASSEPASSGQDTTPESSPQSEAGPGESSTN